MKGLLMKSTAVVLGALLAVGCGDGGGKKGGDAKKHVITQKGSDTMVLLAQAWAEKFGAGHPDIQVQVSGGGSGTGIAALINSTTEICDASRPMSDAEKAQIKQQGAEVVEIPVAKDGITIYVNEASKVDSLTIDQLRGIYLGEVKNWKEVGGADAQVILYGRENSSGTYEFFKEHVLNKKDFFEKTQTLAGTAAIVNAVGKDANGIGYGGAAYAKGVKQLKIVGSGGVAVSPTEENVLSGTYPLSRDLYLYLRQQPSGEIKTYTDWILGADGQAVVKQIGYFPIKGK